jgi:preprotein translocase subunit SecG
MYTFLVVIHIVTCFLIIGIVLLQAGKGADIGSAFGGAGTQAVFGSMGTPTIMGKITAVVATIFTITSFSLAMMGGARRGSVVGEPAPAAVPGPAPGSPVPGLPAPAAPAPAPAK